MTDKAVSYPELPKPWDIQREDDGKPVLVFTADHMRAYADQAVALFLERTGQYVTNDASREAAIAEALDAAREQDRARAAAPQAAVGVDDCGVDDSMALAFHYAITDGSIGKDDLEDIKLGLRAVFVNMPATKPEAPAAFSESDSACAWSLWWSHKKKTFTTTRQASIAAWNEALAWLSKAAPAEAPANEDERPDFEKAFDQLLGPDFPAREDELVQRWISTGKIKGLEKHPAGLVRALARALAAPAQGAAVPDAGYAGAFYELGALMGLTAQPLSPEAVWNGQMLPMLKAALANAERYRWLSDRSGTDVRSLLDVGDFTSLDAFIDRALRAARQKGGV